MQIARNWKTNDSFPAEWDCWTPEGEYVYVQYRWGVLIAEVAENEREWFMRNFRAAYCRDFEKKYDGIMSTEDMLKHLAEFSYESQPNSPQPQSEADKPQTETDSQT